MNKFWAALHGAFWCVLFAFPGAVLLVSVWRFPIPFAGYRSGPGYVVEALFAAGFYIIIGGFVVLGVLGAFAGLVARTLRPEDEREQKRLSRIVTALIALAIATLLAALDKLIGPW
jgi:Na+/phosphate symporter